MADVNDMQASMDLGGMSGVMAGVPTQALNMPQTMHPGQFSAMASAQAAIQAQNTARMSMMFTPSAQAGMMGGGATYSPALGMNNPMVDMYAQQYAANMGSLGMGRAPMYGPSAMGLNPLTGLSGMPPAAMMTSPEFGVYRAAGPYGTGPDPFMGMFRPTVFNPLTFGGGSSQFMSPVQSAQAAAVSTNAQFIGAGQTALSGAGQVAMGLGAGVVGRTIGAVLGGMAAGPAGAVAGTYAGGMLGPMGAQLTGVPTAISNAAASFVTDPVSTILHTQQLGRNVFTAGPNVGMGGLGLDFTSSAAMGPMLQRMGYQRATGMNTADVSALMEGSAQQGLLNDVSGVSQGANQLSRIARSVRELMRVTNDPDVMSALKELASMRNMGADFPDAVQAFKGIRGFARMAGTNPAGIRDYANAGGLAFQGMGLTGSVGAVYGAAGAGMARQAIATGTYSPESLALMGGESGLAQRGMESNLAFLRMPMLAAYAAGTTGRGAFAASPAAINELARGNVSLQGLASGGALNLSAAVARDGIGALGAYFATQGDVQNQVASAIGPLGTDALKKMQALDTMRMMGLKGASGFLTAAYAMTQDLNTARQMTAEITNPAFRSELRRKNALEMQTESAENIMALRNMEGPGFLSALSGDPRRGERFNEMFITGSLATAVNEFAARQARRSERGAALERGMDVFQVPLAFTPANAEAAARLTRPTTERSPYAGVAEGVFASAAKQAFGRTRITKAEFYELSAARGDITSVGNALFADYDNPEYMKALEGYSYVGKLVAEGTGAVGSELIEEDKQLKALGISGTQSASMALQAVSDIEAAFTSNIGLFTDKQLDRQQMEAAMTTALESSPVYQNASDADKLKIREAIFKKAIRLANPKLSPKTFGAGIGMVTQVSSANLAMEEAQKRYAGELGKLGIEGDTVAQGALRELAGVPTKNVEETALLGLLAARQTALAPEQRNAINSQITQVLGAVSAKDANFSLDVFSQKYRSQISQLATGQVGGLQRLLGADGQATSGSDIIGAAGLAIEMQKRSNVETTLNNLISPQMLQGTGLSNEEISELRAKSPEEIISKLRTLGGTSSPAVQNMLKRTKGLSGEALTDALRSLGTDYNVTSNIVADSLVAKTGPAATSQAMLFKLEESIGTTFPTAVDKFDRAAEGLKKYVENIQGGGQGPSMITNTLLTPPAFVQDWFK